MTESTLIQPIFISVTIGLAVMLGVVGFSTFRSPTMVARGRVEALVRGDSPYAADLDASIRRRRGRFAGITEGLGAGTSRRTQLALQRSGLPLRVGEYIAIRLMALAAGGGLAALLAGMGGNEPQMILVLSLAGILVGFVLPPFVVSYAAKRRAAAIEQQLVELCELMASMLRSGYGYVQALTATAAELENPLSNEIARLVDAVRLGGDVDEELQELNERLGSHDFDMIATAISIQRRSGGNLAEILEGVAETVRHRQTFRRELRALTARERFSAVIVAGLPLALLAFLVAVDGERYGLFFNDPRGQIMLALVFTLDIIGYFVIKQVSKVEV